MKQYRYSLLILLIGLFSSCTQVLLGPDKSSTEKETVFEEFWRQVDRNYSGLTVRPVNWDSLYKVYRPQVTAQTTDEQLAKIVQLMITPINDNHVYLTANGKGYGSLTDPYSTTIIADYLGTGVVSRRLGVSYLDSYKNLFYYGKSAGNIGYVAISSFVNSQFTQADFNQFDPILEQFRDTKGLIIDIRQNNGGSEDFAAFVAGRFATERRVYKLSRTKTGPGRQDYGDYSVSTLIPRGSWTYTKPVAVLMNNRVFSTGNNFLMMMRVQPTVLTIGGRSGDGVNGPVNHELSNGWIIALPNQLSYLPDKTVVEGRGIPPGIEVHINAQDRQNSRDTVLEKALEQIGK